MKPMRIAQAVAMATLLFVGMGCSTQSPQLSGDGTLFGQLDCLGIEFDSGENYPISFWPDGYTAKRSPGATPNGTLVDSAGNVVLREGDRLNARVSVISSSGDTRCSSTAVATVLEFKALSGSSQAP